MRHCYTPQESRQRLTCSNRPTQAHLALGFSSHFLGVTNIKRQEQLNIMEGFVFEVDDETAALILKLHLDDSKELFERSQVGQPSAIKISRLAGFQCITRCETLKLCFRGSIQSTEISKPIIFRTNTRTRNVQRCHRVPCLILRSH